LIGEEDLAFVGRAGRAGVGAAVARGGAVPLVGTLESALAGLAQDAPGVIVNTVGPFTTTARVAAGRDAWEFR
jgi:hypothetical protein